MRLFLLSRKKLTPKNIARKANRIEPKVPTSKPEPSKETYMDGEKIAETKKAITIPKPANKILLLGKAILPSTNLATSQRVKESMIPEDSKSPLPTERENCVNGRKKNGKRKTTAKKTKEEARSSLVIFI